MVYEIQQGAMVYGIQQGALEGLLPIENEGLLRIEKAAQENKNDHKCQAVFFFFLTIVAAAGSAALIATSGSFTGGVTLGALSIFFFMISAVKKYREGVYREGVKLIPNKTIVSELVKQNTSPDTISKILEKINEFYVFVNFVAVTSRFYSELPSDQQAQAKDLLECVAGDKRFVDVISEIPTLQISIVLENCPKDLITTVVGSMETEAHHRLYGFSLSNQKDYPKMWAVFANNERPPQKK